MVTSRVFAFCALQCCIPAIACSADCSEDLQRASTFTAMRFDRVLMLEDEATTSANTSIGDLNGDGNLDIVLIRGRHWPVANRILLGDGAGSFAIGTDLGEIEDRSYTGALADLDLDGDLDIVVSNDNPDPSLIYLNDGDAAFTVTSNFGQPDWNTRNVSLADVNYDGLPDVVVANRGPIDGPSPNHVCLNLGEGKFETDCQVLSTESATTISPVDINGDGLQDFVVPHRDGGQAHVYLATAKDRFDFHAIPFGPPKAAIRAAAAADFDCDGIFDIVAIHAGNSEGGDGVVDRDRDFHGAVIYLGRQGGGYAAGERIGSASAMPYALWVDDLNEDGAADVIVGYVDVATSVFLNNQLEGSFVEIKLDDGEGTAYGFATADLDEDGSLDIAVAKSGARNRVFFGSLEPSK